MPFEYGVDTMAVAANIGDETAVKQFTRDVVTKWGRLDILVNNAGIRQVAPIWDTTTAMWDRIHDANLKVE